MNQNIAPPAELPCIERDLTLDDHQNRSDDEIERHNLNRLNSLLCQAASIINDECLPSFDQSDEAYDAVEIAQRIIQDEILGDEEDEVTE
jgi:hypothetical protein